MTGIIERDSETEGNVFISMIHVEILGILIITDRWIANNRSDIKIM